MPNKPGGELSPQTLRVQRYLPALERLGKRGADIRLHFGYSSQQKLADAYNGSAGVIRAMEKGKKGSAISGWIGLANFYRIPLLAFFDDTVELTSVPVEEFVQIDTAHVAEQIERAIKNLGRSQSAFATAVNRDSYYNTMIRLRNGGSNVSVTFLFEVKDELGISWKQLLGTPSSRTRQLMALRRNNSTKRGLTAIELSVRSWLTLQGADAGDNPALAALRLIEPRTAKLVVESLGLSPESIRVRSSELGLRYGLTGRHASATALRGVYMLANPQILKMETRARAVRTRLQRLLPARVSIDDWLCGTLGWEAWKRKRVIKRLGPDGWRKLKLETLCEIADALKRTPGTLLLGDQSSRSRNRRNEPLETRLMRLRKSAVRSPRSVIAMTGVGSLERFEPLGKRAPSVPRTGSAMRLAWAYGRSFDDLVIGEKFNDGKVLGTDWHLTVQALESRIERTLPTQYRATFGSQVARGIRALGIDDELLKSQLILLALVHIEDVLVSRLIDAIGIIPELMVRTQGDLPTLRSELSAALAPYRPACLQRNTDDPPVEEEDSTPDFEYFDDREEHLTAE